MYFHKINALTSVVGALHWSCAPARTTGRSPKPAKIESGWSIFKGKVLSTGYSLFFVILTKQRSTPSPPSTRQYSFSSHLGGGLA